MTKYIKRIGQNTGISRNEKIVQANPIKREEMALYQNLNSGSLRTKGRNSSINGDPLEFPGKKSPSSANNEASLSKLASSSVRDGSNLGLRNSKKMFNKYIPKA